MGLTLVYDDGQTPIDDDEREGLRIRSISTRQELDELEQHNIQQAMLWLMKKSTASHKLLTIEFIVLLHRKMFGDVWKWAGEFRKTNKNIGVDKYEVRLQLQVLLDDCKYWLENKIYEEDELALRFKHRLVSIHCFPNGNGRHSRLMADVIVERLGGKDVFSWGSRNLAAQDLSRSQYLKAIRAADAGNIQPLLDFARS